MISMNVSILKLVMSELTQVMQGLVAGGGGLIAVVPVVRKDGL